jgi:hypothetical protein
MPATREPCRIAGLYRSTCRDQDVLILKPGRRFPRCGLCRRAVRWSLVRPLGGMCAQLEPAHVAAIAD